MTRSGQKIIGVLGGCGPYAGLQLVETIFGQTKAKKDQEHLPVYLSSVPGEIMDRTEYLLDPSIENPAYAIASLIRQMELVGVDVAGIACNTSHAPAIYDVIREELRSSGCTVKLLNIISETIYLLQQTYPHATRIGILSSDGTYRTRLYEDRLIEAGYTVVKPSPAFHHEKIHLCVYHPHFGIKASSAPVTDWAKERIAEATAYFYAQEAEVLILGCTEFSLAADEIAAGGLGVIDSTQALARALIRETHPEKLTQPGLTREAIAAEIG
jgi:aspartate racemase